MDLITRCPQCNATFPVTPEELQLRKGYIRCISCAHIFDGYEAIVPSAPKQAAGRTRPAAPTKIEPIVPAPPVARPRQHQDSQTGHHRDSQTGRDPDSQAGWHPDSKSDNQDTPVHTVPSAPVLPIAVRARSDFTLSRDQPPANAPTREPVVGDDAQRGPTDRGPTDRDATDRGPVVRVRAVRDTAEHDTAKHETAKHDTATHDTARHDTAKHDTAKHDTARHGTAKHGTAKHGPTPREPSLGALLSLPGTSSHEPSLNESSLHDGPSNEPVSQEPVFRFRDRPFAQQDTPGHHLAGDDVSNAALTPTIRVGRPARPDSRPSIEPIYVEPRTTYRRPESADHATFKDDTRGRFSTLGQLFWGVLVLIGLAVLCAQAVFVYRTQIATQMPAMRPVLEQACDALGCTVPYPRRIDEIGIIASSLRARPKTGNVAANEPDTLLLQLTMRNNYDKAQQWPTLVLELKDFSGTVVAKKNLAPREYLSSGEAELPFAPSSEAVISVPITLNGIKINGYQLSKFFP